MRLRDMRGANSFEIMGNIAGLLDQLGRDVPDLKGLKNEYLADAMSGDRERLLEVSERYALDYLPSSLEAHEGDLTDLDPEEDDDD